MNHTVPLTSRFETVRLRPRGYGLGVLWCLLGLWIMGCQTADFIVPPASGTTDTEPVVPDARAALPVTEGCQGQENIVVQVNRLNVRQGPSQSTEVLDIILRQEQYTVIGHSADGEWVHLHLLPSHRTGWVYKPLVTIHCVARPGERVALHNLAHLWSRGETVTGVGYVWQDTTLYAGPDQATGAVGTAGPDRLLVVQRVIQNAAGERWARLWSPAATGDHWIQADKVIPLPATLAGLNEPDTVILGERIQIQQYEHALQRTPLLPPSDGGHLYDRRDYLPVAATAAECDATCDFLQNWPQRDSAWYLPYEDRWIRDATAVAVVPLVPLYEVHVSEGWLWNARQREGYSLENADLGTWVVMSRKMHRERGVRDPGGWLPPNHAGRCRYALDWISVKERWDLAMDEHERQVLTDVLSLCDDRYLVTTAFALAQTPGANLDDGAPPAGTSMSVRVQCDARNEIITIANPGTQDVNLVGWHLHDANNENRFTLPRWTLYAGSSVTVVSGEAVGDIQLTDAPIWHNQDDTVYLYDASYNLVAVQSCV